MNHAIIGAFLMTFAMSLLGGIAIWGSCLKWQGYKDGVERWRQGRPSPAISALLAQPAMPRSLVSLWRASPSLVLSGIYISLSLEFGYFLVDMSGPHSPLKRSFASKFWWICAHTTPRERLIGCGIWLIPLLFALVIFSRSAIIRLRVVSSG